MHTQAAAEAEENGVLPGNTNNDLSALEDWRLWCRLCAKEDSQGNINVFFKDEQQPQPVTCGGPGSTNSDLSLVVAIDKFFWVKIQRDKELPKMICTECFSLLTSLVNFSERVSKVQQMFEELQHDSTEHIKLDFHAVRLKYGILDEEREHVLLQHPVTEVHYLEAKPKINELEERMFETDAIAGSSNPLEQPRIKIKIKKENIIQADDEDVEEEEEEDDNEEEEDSDYEDPFNGEIEDEVGVDDYKSKQRPEKETSSENEKREKKKRENPEVAKIKNELSELQDDKVIPKKRRRRHKRKHCLMDKVKRAAENHTDTEDDDESSPRKQKAEFVCFSCSECARKFKRIQHYRQHMKRTHSMVAPMPEMKCPQCSRIFTTQHQLVKHAKVHLPLEMKKIVPCPYCEKKFTSNTLVQTHIKHIHMNERPFICEECGVAVRTNASLKTHMLTHTDYAPFECDVCKKGFKNQIRLKNHLETHDPNKHVCAECGLQLNSRATLNRHLLVHSDEMQHKCDYCGRAFKRAKALKNHLILHTGLKPYSCDFCERTFANGSNCRSHKKKAHPEELAALEATGAGKTYTRNIPKLEALKAVTKAADNLAPVVSKQSGRFAFGKKPKQAKDDNNDNTAIRAHMPTSHSGAGAPIDLNALHSTIMPTAAALMGTNNVASIPTIDNIYSHIMKQATIAAQNASNAIVDAQDPCSPSAITIQIKRPPSQASSCVTLEHDSTSDMQQHMLLQQQQVQSHSQPPTPTPTAPQPVVQHFYTQLVKHTHEQQMPTMPAQHQQTLSHQQLQPQPAREDISSSIRSPDSRASSQIADDQASNASATHFYNHIRQNLQGAPYM